MSSAYITQDDFPLTLEEYEDLESYCKPTFGDAQAAFPTDDTDIYDALPFSSLSPSSTPSTTSSVSFAQSSPNSSRRVAKTVIDVGVVRKLFSVESQHTSSAVLYTNPPRPMQYAHIATNWGLPLPEDTFYHMVETSRTLVVDKSAALRTLISARSGDRDMILIRRPPGFGKTTAVEMLNCYHDGGYSSDLVYNQAFGSTTLCQTHHVNRECGPVLSFDLAQISVEDPDSYALALRNYFHLVLRGFMSQHQSLLGLDLSRGIPPHALSGGQLNLPWVFDRWLRNRDEAPPLFITIDNYNHPEIQSKDDIRIVEALMDEFIYPLSLISERLCRGGYIFGSEIQCDVDRDVHLSDLGIWGILAEDYTFEPSAATLLGLTALKVTELCTVFSLPGFHDEIFEKLPIYHYWRMYAGVYNTRDVLDMLRVRMAESSST